MKHLNLGLIITLILGIVPFVSIQGQFNGDVYQDNAFWQETHEAYPLSVGGESNEVRSIVTDSQANVWIATASGVFVKKHNLSEWRGIMSTTDKGPAFSVAVDAHLNIWMGTWNGIYRFADNQLQQLSGVDGPISIVCPSDEGLYAIGPKGIWFFNGKIFTKKNYDIPRSVRDAISDNQGGLWLASDVGLYHINKEGKSRILRNQEEVQSGYIKGIAIAQNQDLWVGGLGGVSVLHQFKKHGRLRPKKVCQRSMLPVSKPPPMVPFG